MHVIPRYGRLNDTCCNRVWCVVCQENQYDDWRDQICSLHTSTLLRTEIGLRCFRLEPVSPQEFIVHRRMQVALQWQLLSVDVLDGKKGGVSSGVA